MAIRDARVQVSDEIFVYVVRWSNKSRVVILQLKALINNPSKFYARNISS